VNPYRSLLVTILPLVAASGCRDYLVDTSSGTAPDTDPDADTDVGTDTDTGLDTDGTCDPSLIVAELGCISMPPEATECPDPASVDVTTVTPAGCGNLVLAVTGPGTPGTCDFIQGGFAPYCEYPISSCGIGDCDYGRPFTVEGTPRTASATASRTWMAGDPPDVSGLSPERRRRLAGAWTRVALAEHASVASFARFTLDLMAVGAPPDLLLAAQAAAADEIGHARIAFGLASAYAGEDVGPGPLSADGALGGADLVALAVATAREGAVAETISALQMAEAASRASDPAVRAALRDIAADESRHAALAWRTLRWALMAGGDPVREALAALFASEPVLEERVDVGDPDHGVLSGADRVAIALRAWREVVQPAARALLA
jgi:hypothetical protein